ncbi:hypothetical protein FNH05_33410 [Amycolatopsis rhizosphaerae]|uniref:Uncharacterized protein n=1 Tax=Amycolatopsis rhizosphaerae TaxID=2053003 RepID=A0A558AEC6_9PSEU|nr:hypothetical protein [Amycolatopsis rhizosphaerae]TVT22611.1 hypothetical protein FNH05_33410 [Amycolatopsis rhizosphaerae]
MRNITLSTGARRWVPKLFLAAAVLLVPWVIVLAETLPLTPQATEVRHWATAWIGLDLMMALGCAATGWLYRRGDGRSGVTAAAVGAIALLDAWFDVLTAQSGADLAQALACAVPELSLVALCVLVALDSPVFKAAAPSGNSPREPGTGVRGLRPEGTSPAHRGHDRRRATDHRDQSLRSCRGQQRFHAAAG